MYSVVFSLLLGLFCFSLAFVCVIGCLVLAVLISPGPDFMYLPHLLVCGVWCAVCGGCAGVRVPAVLISPWLAPQVDDRCLRGPAKP